MDWIIILFLIHIDDFRVEKVKELAQMTIFTSGTQSGKLGFETFEEHFKA